MEDRFFVTISVLILISTIVGFRSKDTFAGMFFAPQPNRFMHVHAAAFFAWIVLLVVQTSLIAAGRRSWHRRLGVGGFVLAAFMVVIALLTAADDCIRGNVPPVFSPVYFFYFLASEILTFAPLVAAAYIWRRTPSVHKRLILLATISIFDAGVSRWPIPAIANSDLAVGTIVYCFVAALIIFDILSTRTVARATIFGTIFIIAMRQSTDAVAKSHAWQVVGMHILDAGRAFYH